MPLQDLPSLSLPLSVSLSLSLSVKARGVRTRHQGVVSLPSLIPLRSNQYRATKEPNNDRSHRTRRQKGLSPKMDTVLQSHRRQKIWLNKIADLLSRLSIVLGTCQPHHGPFPGGAALDSVPDELVSGGGSVWAESILLCATLRVNTL